MIGREDLGGNYGWNSKDGRTACMEDENESTKRGIKSSEIKRGRLGDGEVHNQRLCLYLSSLM